MIPLSERPSSSGCTAALLQSARFDMLTDQLSVHTGCVAIPCALPTGSCGDLRASARSIPPHPPTFGTWIQTFEAFFFKLYGKVLARGELCANNNKLHPWCFSVLARHHANKNTPRPLSSLFR